MCGNCYLSAIDIELAGFRGTIIDDDTGRTVVILDAAVFNNGCFLGNNGFVCYAGCIDLLFTDQGWISIEILVGKKPRGTAGIVEDIEPELAVIIPYPGSPSDDLLEFGHRTDNAC